MGAVKRLKPVNTVHPAIKRFYEKKRMWKKWLVEHARKTAMIQNAVITGMISEQDAVNAYGEYIGRAK